MKLVTWNCCGGFSRKLDALRSLEPDIAVIQEVLERDLDNLPLGTHAVWLGPQGKKGLAVIGFNGWRIERAGECAERWFLPVRGSKDDQEFDVIGVYVAAVDGYVAPSLRALEELGPILARANCIVAGDFNANAIWDKRAGTGRRFSDLVSRFSTAGLESAWHRAMGEAYGAERQPTIFHMWSPEKPYHIDYIFGSEPLLARMTSIEIGTYADWTAKKLSDHVPLSAVFTF